MDGGEGDMGAAAKNVLREVDADAIRLAKTLLRSARFGALAVLDPKTGWPLASRVGTATDADGAPLILVSALSAHTSALRADPRVSLLLGEPGKGDPLAHPRITIRARAAPLARESREGRRAERRYLARHPKAALYAGLGDFCFVRLEPEGASLNGGFGRAYELSRDELMTSGPAAGALQGVEPSAVTHLNADHKEAVSLYATHFARAPEGDWVVTGIDLDGMDLAHGDEVRRVFFTRRPATPEDLRLILAEMAREARSAQAKG